MVVDGRCCGGAAVVGVLSALEGGTSPRLIEQMFAELVFGGCHTKSRDVTDFTEI